MADVKVSGLPNDPTVDGGHYVVLNDPTGPTTKRGFLSTLAAWFFDQLNIPDGSGSPRTRAVDAMFDYIASGLIWSGDAYASTRAASMTSGVVYINGRRISINAVTARSFTASKDTYIDILDNADGTGTLVYTEVTNNATSPALAANSMRIGIIITGASNIASVASVNQGQEDKFLPLVSSVPYAVCDGLGNMIAPRDPLRRTLSTHLRITQAVASSGTTIVELLDLAQIVKVPAGRKIRVSVAGEDLYASVSNASAIVTGWEGAVTSGRQLFSYRGFQNGGSGTVGVGLSRTFTPLTTNPTIRIGLSSSTTGNATMDGQSAAPIAVSIDLM